MVLPRPNHLGFFESLTRNSNKWWKLIILRAFYGSLIVSPKYYIHFDQFRIPNPNEAKISYKCLIRGVWLGQNLIWRHHFQVKFNYWYFKIFLRILAYAKLKYTFYSGHFRTLTRIRISRRDQKISNQWFLDASKVIEYECDLFSSDLGLYCFLKFSIFDFVRIRI